jgi:hypothetical protein
LAFWHDARSKKDSDPNTLIQAFLRPCHYASCYANNPQRIHLYVDKTIVELAAYDDMDAYIKAGGKPPTRTKFETAKNSYKYGITELFDDKEEVRSYLKSILSGTPGILSLCDDGKTFKYRGKTIPLYHFETQTKFLEMKDIRTGMNEKTPGRFMPVLYEDKVKWIGVYDKSFLKGESSSFESIKQTHSTKHSMYTL